MKEGDQLWEGLTLECFADEEHQLAHALLQVLSKRLNAANIQLMLSSPQAATEKERDQYRVVSASILSALTTLSSILTLTEELNLRVKEAVALARVYYETCLMAVFVSLDDGSRARRAELYSIYKMFRTQTRVHSAAGYTEPDRVYRRRLSSYSAARVTVFKLS